MTRVTTSIQPNSGSNNYSSRGHGLNHNRTFKKSHCRAPLTSISLNNSRNGHGLHHNNNNNNNNKRNPFTSFQPNKSGIISKDDDDDDDDDSNEPSDFSHFLSPQNSPSKTHCNSSINPQKQANNHQNITISTNSNSNNSRSTNMISSQSRSNRSNQNVTLREREKNNHNNDDFIFAGLQRYNSMTVPFINDSSLPIKQNNDHYQIQQQQQQKPQKPQKQQNNNKYILDYIPSDWCLKKILYFVSDESLDWCSNIPLKIRNAAMHQIPFQSLQITDPLQEKQYKFYQNMIYYQYPSNKWEQSQLTMIHKFYLKNSQKLGPLQKAKDKNISQQFGIVSNGINNHNEYNNNDYAESMYNLFIDRICEWMQSFHSLYALFRQQFTQFIYIHFPDFFNIIFCQNDDKPKCIITNTHQSFRNNLKKQNIVFSTPLIQQKQNNKENEANDGDADDDDDEDDDDPMDLEEFQRNGINVRMNKKRKANGFGLNYNNKDRTVTLIEGKRNVHNFYDFLINYMHRWCLSIKKCHDIPLLLSDRLFLNSKCSLISITKNLSGLTENKQKLYTMQLNGYILPSVYKSIINLFYLSNQNASISSGLNDKMCFGVNYCAKSRLFQKIKDEENKNFTSINKIQLNAKDNKECIVYLQ